MSQQRETVVVVGGGAAGLACAITAAACGDEVTLVERMDRVGRKLAATGNGRCNLMNTGEPRYHGDSGMAKAVLALCGPGEQAGFWRDLGLPLREETEGRVYPATMQAGTVVDLLRFHAERLGVCTVIGQEVRSLKRTPDGWLVTAQDAEFSCSRVVVAGGGKAQPNLGSNGTAGELLRQQGHHLTPCKTSLTPLITDPQPIRGLSGIRVKAKVRLLRQGTALGEEEGELLFTDYGVSGICVMQLSRDAAAGDVLSVNLADAMGCGSPAECLASLRLRRSMWRDQEAERLLCGLAVPRVGKRLFDAARCPLAGRTAGELTEDELRRLAGVCCDYRIPVKGKRGFEYAQVTAGGVQGHEFDWRTMESRLAPGLYAAGEVLDVDGDCGGFNLMFAFASGILAGLRGRPSPYRRELP